MSAWTKGLEDAPKKEPILVRLPKWDCPAVMRHETFEGETCWIFVEQVLSDIAGGLEPDDVVVAEWARIPS